MSDKIENGYQLSEEDSNKTLVKDLKEVLLGDGGMPLFQTGQFFRRSAVGKKDARWSELAFEENIQACVLLEHYLDSQNADEVEEAANQEKLFKIVWGFPLICPPAMVTWWKDKGAMDALSAAAEVDQQRMKAILEDASNPWGAFSATPLNEESVQAKAWLKWLKNTPRHGEYGLYAILAHTKQKFSDALKNDKIVKPDPVCIQNARCVAKWIGLGEADTKIFEVFANKSYYSSSSNGIDLLFQELLKDLSFGGSTPIDDEAFSIASIYFNLPEDELKSLFDPQKPLVKLGFLNKHIVNNNHASSKYLFFYSLKGSLFSKIQRDDFQDEEEFAKSFFNLMPELKQDFDLDHFAHLRPEIDNIQKALTSDKNVRILMWGPPGSGKSTLAQVLMSKAGRIVATPIGAGFNSDKDHNHGANRLIHLKVAEKMAPIFKGAALMVDESENLLNSTEYKDNIIEILDQKPVTEVWIANDLSKIHAAYLRRFDCVLHVPEMPFWARDKLAHDLFEDPQIAARVAQSCRSPAEIVAIHEWCSAVGEEKWPVISQKIAGFQKAVTESAKSSDGAFSITVVPPDSMHTKGLDAIAGYENIKKQARAFVHLFEHPEKYKSMGAKVPKGLLLTGEPGSGKTLFTRSLASEVGVPLVMADSSSLAEDPSRLGLLFSEARKRAPCMVFLDEVDCIAANPQKPDGTMDLEKQKITNRLLVEMDGFDALEGVLVIAATHREYGLDKAILRSGRFGKKLSFHLPAQEDRVAIWNVVTSERKVVSGVDWDHIARASAGLSGADMEQAMNVATLEAVFDGEEQVTEKHIIKAVDQVFWGEEMAHLGFTEEGFWSLAVHEAGHALMGLLHGKHVERVTVRPHKEFLGANHFPEPEELGNPGRDQCEADAQISMGGIAAEQVLLGYYGQGGTGDLRHVHDIFYRLALKTGLMSDKIGYMHIVRADSHADALLNTLDQEEKRFTDEAFKKALDLLDKHKEALMGLAKTLQTMRDLNAKELLAWASKNKIDVGVLARKTKNLEPSYLTVVKQDTPSTADALALSEQSSSVSGAAMTLQKQSDVSVGGAAGTDMPSSNHGSGDSAH